MNLAKIENGKLSVIWSDNTEIDGYKQFSIDEKPILNNIQGVEEYYQEMNNKIIVRYKIIDNDPVKINKEIERLKNELAQWDYKVSKNNEYRDIGLPLPYDPIEIFNTRQPYRDEINRLESLIQTQ